MAWLALGAGILLLLLWLLYAFANARVETIRKAGAWGLGAVGAVLLVLLVLSGRAGQAIWATVFFGPVIWRLVQGWRAARRFAGPGGAAGLGGEETSVETATLAMRLDHATGRMSGRVLRGAFAGRELAELGLPELLALLAECHAGDAESVPLVEAWLDRVAPDWRSAGGAEAAGGGAPTGGGAMTREEALAVLGLTEGATAEQIRAAHRRLMLAAHPDHGGSDWLAARINQARDLLLG